MDGINAYRSFDPVQIKAQLNSNAAAKDTSAAGTNAKGTNAASASAGEAKKLDKAASDFEALFINHMLKTMRESSIKNDLFDGGKGEEIYTSMLDQELSTVMSQGEGIGLKRALMKQLLNQAGISEPASGVKQDAPAAIKPVLNNQAAIKEFQSHIQLDEFRSPVAGKISSGYGLRKDPVSGKHAMHSGIDIAAPEGTPVYPSAAGEVVFSGKREGYGNLIEIIHDNAYLSRYGNNNELRATVGERVSPYDIIALVGGSEEANGPHLHFETVVEGYEVNPVDLVNFN